jgi:peptidoglycan/LPS O-acetylase OafA/YrhL
MLPSELFPKHRTDIDGLRAVAVLSVILFHYNIPGANIRGGFIGVDVFLVISGYLITGIIFRGIDDGSYTIANFYNRRIRRIFPALFVVFGFCIVTAFFLDFPSEALSTGRSITASIFFVSNILFYLRSGYFNPDSETDPLLHTWSLSVEEQFYLIFPVVVFLLRKFDNRIRIYVISALALASFFYSAYMVRTDSSATFYLPQFRAWELLIGSLLALGAIPPLSRRWACEMIAATGLIVLCASFLLISRVSLFPGPVALGPCIGAAAILYSGRMYRNYIGQFLSFRPIQFIGLISYSLYLWHWPIFVFFRVFHEPDRIEKCILVAASIIVATLSWKFIEKPFREAPYRLNAKGTLLTGAASMAFATTVTLLLSTAIEEFWKYPARAIDVVSYAKIDESNMRAGKCFLTTVFRADYNERFKHDCLSIKQDQPNILIVGDSHAAQLWSGMQSTIQNVNFLQGTASGCKPLYRGGGMRYCTETMNYVLEDFVPSSHLDGIIIAARWELADLPALIATAKRLSNFTQRLVVFGPIVEYDRALPRILAQAIVSNESPSEAATRHRRIVPKEYDQAFASALHNEGITYFSTYEAICNPDCNVWADADVPMQFDYGHLTKEGSAFLAKSFWQQLCAEGRWYPPVIQAKPPS